MRRTTIIVTIMFVALLSVMAGAHQAYAAGAAEALGWLKAHQNPDGGFAEPGAGSDVTLTCWAMLAGKAAGEDPVGWKQGANGPLEYLAAQAPSITELPQLEMVTLAVAECGGNPASLGGRDMVALVRAHIGAEGRIGKDVQQHCWGLIALAAAGSQIPGKCTEWLASAQRADGGWGESDAVKVADTALGVEAMVAAGQLDDTLLKPALSFLHDRINGDGGFTTSSSRPSDTQLTATAMRAIRAAGQDPGSAQWDFQGLTPVIFLQSMQQGDGHFHYSNGTDSDPSLTTAMATVSTSGKHLPLAAAAAGARAAAGVRDLGTAGQNMAAGRQAADTPVAVQGQGGDGATGATARRGGWPAGLWVFLAVCAAYVVLLAAAAMLARRFAAGRVSR